MMTSSQFKFRRPDLKSKQLVAPVRVELFLVCQQQLARSTKLMLVGSNSRSISDDEEGQSRRHGETIDDCSMAHVFSITPRKS
jgi:hypothetical protein